MKPLERPDSIHLDAARGWLMLGNYAEASKDLESIAPLVRTHPDALEVLWHIYAHVQNWDAYADISNAIVESAPDRASGWVTRSYALRRATRGSLQAPWDALLPAAGRVSESSPDPV